MKEKDTICYDMSIKPIYLSFSEVVEIWDKKKWLIYDSSAAPHNPKPYPFLLEGGEKIEGSIDVSKEENMELYNQIKDELK